jgi:7,8-dihydroneopterin aldolase/epimerase/oxygenase
MSTNSKAMPDTIILRKLRLVSRIGVPQEERVLPQTVTVSAEIELKVSWRRRGDDLSATLDYAAVAQTLREVAARGERQLIETLADDLAAAILDNKAVAEVRLEVEKYILPDCEGVAVRVTRSDNS